MLEDPILRPFRSEDNYACLADCAIVVASDAETGGTWAGATETLKNKWVPVFVLEHGQMPDGNKLLLQKGAPFPILLFSAILRLFKSRPVESGCN